MVDQFDPRAPTRNELSQVFKDQRTLRAFEKIFDLIPSEFNELQEGIDENTAAIEALTLRVEQNEQDIAALQALIPIISIQSSDYTTERNEKIVCTAAITVSLNADPVDLETVTVVATNGRVNISGNGKNISGNSLIKITRNYTALDLFYSADADEWYLQ